MSSLKYSEKTLLEKILGMNTGYVSDFSDRTFQEFVLEEIEVDIFTKKFEANGTSKANRLRTFWKEEPDVLTANLIEALLKHAENEKTQYDRDLTMPEARMFGEANKIVQRLRNEPERGASVDTKKSAFVSITEGAAVDGLTMEGNTVDGNVDFLRNEGKLKDGTLSNNRHLISPPLENGKDSLLEKLTNNQTFANIIGGLILLIILYWIYRFSGINLSTF